MSQLTFAGNVDANVGGLGFIEHPPLVLRVFWVLFTKIIPDDLPRSGLVGIAEFPSEFGRFIRSHNSECRPYPGTSGVTVGLSARASTHSWNGKTPFQASSGL